MMCPTVCGCVCKYRSQPVWAPHGHWWGDSGVWGLDGGLCVCDSSSVHAKAGTRRATQKQKQHLHSASEVTCVKCRISSRGKSLTLLSDVRACLHTRTGSVWWVKSRAAVKWSTAVGLTFTLCMWMQFPQSSRYCFRSLSWTAQINTVRMERRRRLWKHQALRHNNEHSSGA